jgi:hypothetical protein
VGGTNQVPTCLLPFLGRPGSAEKVPNKKKNELFAKTSVSRERFVKIGLAKPVFNDCHAFGGTKFEKNGVWLHTLLKTTIATLVIYDSYTKSARLCAQM